MSSARLERLVNLTLALMATSRPLTVADIAAGVPGYGGEPLADGSTTRPDVGDEAFRRMFERDKEALREQGIPLVAEPVSIWDDNEVGYRIPRQAYSLPDLHLDPDEAAALGLAARLWASASLAEGVATALRKLEAVGTDLRVPEIGVDARVEAVEPAFEPALAAVRAGQAVTFSYRGVRDSAERTRTVEPWGIVSWHGHWYLVGHDRDRAAERVFRLSRVASDLRPVGPPGAVTPPPDLDLSARVAAVEPGALVRTAVVRAQAGAGHALRRTATGTAPGPDGTDLLTLTYTDPERLAEMLSGLAPEVVALEPVELRDAVVARLRAVLA